ncbi:MAG: methyltransferase domain-containing protein [Candidatus Methanoperedens sp.]
MYEKIWKRKEPDAVPEVEKGSRADVALKLLEKGDKLLDIGCGDGIVGYFVANDYKQIYGVDVSDIALKIAEKRGVITRKMNVNNDALPYEDNFFDAITCLDVIEHVFEPFNLITEIFRVMKNGGILIISTPNIRYWHHLFDMAINGRFPKTSGDVEHYDGGHLHYFTFRDIEEMLEKRGFKVIQRSGVFGKDFMKEFLSPGIVIKAKKIFSENTDEKETRKEGVFHENSRIFIG